MKKIAISSGDPSGVGPEIILKWAQNNPQYAERVEVLAHKTLLEKLPANFGKKLIESADNFILGKPSYDGAKLAYDALTYAAKGCVDGVYSAVVTAPVSKAQMIKIDPKFIGQTEFFEKFWGGKAVMCFAGEKLILSLATWHIPLKEVASAINKDNLERAIWAANELAKKIRKLRQPRIALCGLNPHAGEGGILGLEELEIINPIAKNLQSDFPNLSLALPPDTVFNRALKNEFDSIVALYHDQGLAPLKAVDFDNAVNISMGLTHVRTSPDHGTAFDIAGKGIADFKSFANAVKIAEILAE